VRDTEDLWLRLSPSRELTLEATDLEALSLTLRLASWTTCLTLCVGTPLAYWLARGPSRWKSVVSSLTALPLVLPPTVLGFYLLTFFGPRGWGGALSARLGLPRLVFSFEGLVVASLLCSLPFVVQPLVVAFRGISQSQFDAAATLRMGPLRTFLWVAAPQARAGFWTAAILGFAHTIGEFGVVLMLGGNIPGKTRVLSIALYEHVEGIRYARAHTLSLVLVGLSLLALGTVTWLPKGPQRGIHDPA
jgi:molybdate transport system permease protein